MTHELDAALAWANEPLVVIDDHDLAHDLVEARFNAGILAAEVRRTQAMRCADCKHRFVGMAPAGRPHFAYCKRTKVPVPELGTQTYVMCVELGNGCLAWEKKDE